MLKRTTLCAAAIASAFVIAPGANAEEKKAICEFRNHGETKQNKTGPCTYSSDDEEIRVKLVNGDTYRFVEEAKRKGHYIDQDGNRLDVQASDGYKLTYRWKNQRLIVMLAES